MNKILWVIGCLVFPPLWIVFFLMLVLDKNKKAQKQPQKTQPQKTQFDIFMEFYNSLETVEELKDDSIFIYKIYHMRDKNFKGYLKGKEKLKLTIFEKLAGLSQTISMNRLEWEVNRLNSNALMMLNTELEWELKSSIIRAAKNKYPELNKVIKQG